MTSKRQYRVIQALKHASVISTILLLALIPLTISHCGGDVLCSSILPVALTVVFFTTLGVCFSDHRLGMLAYSVLWVVVASKMLAI